jgi:shikimate 5-dehydrogenase
MIQAIQAAADTCYPQAVQPTIYFIGVTTGKSSIMTVFPRWAEYLGLKDAVIRGIDCQWHDEPAVYRRIVEHIKRDPMSLGALVTTHKIDLLAACRDLFEELDPFAQLLGEVSGISKRANHLCGHAKDPISSGLALEAFRPPGHWERTGGEALVLGAGGSSIAFTCYLIQKPRSRDRPARILVTNRSRPRLEEMAAIHRRLDCTLPVEYIHAPRPQDNDHILNQLRPHSLAINATGLGKDAPGSPITDAAVFPEQGWAWDFNYRGDLLFLEQARRQQESRRLWIEDGWIYFLHGWTQVIAEVFHIAIPTSGPDFVELGRIAAGQRR